ncbi:Translation initiation factor IF-2 [Gossypium arboreum]|uniref:Translation initiation factor IF-2 n=1 Tax=Gossypium arboreum TaxID=29729 RepID=A0A0B0PP28_GOSAR|nr:Translation initiation factor IF-2 [Gossypium arboreum]
MNDNPASMSCYFLEISLIYLHFHLQLSEKNKRLVTQEIFSCNIETVGMLHPHPGTTSASVTPATTGSSFPKITACKHATASAANPIPWSGGHHSAVIGLKASLPHLTLLRSYSPDGTQKRTTDIHTAI